jgi:hypothetical protein
LSVVRHSGDRVQFKGGIPLHVSTQGTELESVKLKIAEDTISRIKRTAEGSVLGGVFYLSSTESQRLTEDIVKLLSSYSLTSNRNRQARKYRDFRTQSLLLLDTAGTMFNAITEI